MRTYELTIILDGVIWGPRGHGRASAPMRAGRQRGTGLGVVWHGVLALVIEAGLTSGLTRQSDRSKRAGRAENRSLCSNLASLQLNL
jgi:hypothetical protein